MSKVTEWLKGRFHKIDKDDALRWGFLVGGGILTLVSGVFEQRRKDRLYREQLPKEVEKQAKRIADAMKES